MSPKSKDCVPVKRQNTDTGGRELCDVGGRSGSDVAKDARIAGSHQAWEEQRSLEPCGGWFCQILGFRLLARDLTFLLFYFMEFVVMTDLRN